MSPVSRASSASSGLPKLRHLSRTASHESGEDRIAAHRVNIEERTEKENGLTVKEPRSLADPRRRGRELALQSLYEGDLVGHDPLAVLDRVIADEELADTKVDLHARRLVAGVTRERAAIDHEISRAAPAWPIEQMPAVDKNLLRLAIYEVLFDNGQVPMKAAINEAVEIAKRFGSESSSRFVNGVLGTVVSGQERGR